MNGALVKLTIIPFASDSDIQKPPVGGIPDGPPFIAQFNPESFTESTTIEFKKSDVQGTNSSEAKFERVAPRTFSFDLTFDGTGATGTPLIPNVVNAVPIPSLPPQPLGGLGVAPAIELFKELVAFKSNEHRPPFFVVTWGTFFARCVLESFSINYKLFSPLGVPLRAVISTSWREHSPQTLRQLISNLLSPDVTHQHIVKEGDYLSLITNSVYDTPNYYYQVAEKNNLDNLRKLEVGSNLQLHPLK